jgi:pyruvate-formate lyase-activating enzyme
MWQDADGPERLHRILRWIARLPYSVGLRLQTIGEPFVSEEFLAEASRMTRERNIRFIELVTNGSLLTSRLRKMSDDYGADISKLTLWITYHHTEISAEHLIENASYAQDLGAFVVVNALLFPDSVEPVARLQELCAARNLRTNVDLGQVFNDAYPGLPFIPLAGEKTMLDANALVQNRKLALVSIVAAAAPKGLNCSAGYDYVFIGRAGDVFPCLGYHRYLPTSRLGSALDPDFIPPLRANMYRPCGVEKGCTCKEDFLHLEAARPGPTRERSLGYWPAATEQFIDPLLLERVDRINQSGILAEADFWKRHIRQERLRAGLPSEPQ